MDLAFSMGWMAAISLLATKSLIPFAYKVGLLDVPDTRKRHEGAIPLVGGIAIYLSVLIMASINLSLPSEFMAVGAICGVVTLLGAIDDRYPAHPVYRLLIQLLSGISIAAIGSICLYDLGNLFGFGAVTLGVLAIPFTAVALTGLCNAFNMVDGIDGLAASLALVSISGLLILVGGEGVAAHLLIYFAVALIIFLIFNLQLLPWLGVKIFLGDAGSMLLGSVVAIALIYFSQLDSAPLNPATALWLVAVPLMDMASTMLRRVSKGRSPIHPDRTHLHHILQRAGLPVRQCLLVIVLIATTFALFGIGFELAFKNHSYLSFSAFLGCFALYYLCVIKHAFRFTVKARRFFEKLKSRRAVLQR